MTNLHILFVGPPGCGKTLVKRCVKDFLKKQGHKVVSDVTEGTNAFGERHTFTMIGNIPDFLEVKINPNIKPK